MMRISIRLFMAMACVAMLAQTTQAANIGYVARQDLWDQSLDPVNVPADKATALQAYADADWTGAVALIDWLENTLGHTVNLYDSRIDDPEVVKAQNDIVYICESMSSSRVRTNSNYMDYTDSYIPVFFGEAAIFDEMGLTVGGASSGTSSYRATTATIVDDTHPITSGLTSGTTYVLHDTTTSGSESFSPQISVYGNELTTDGVHILARVGDGRVFLSAYESGIDLDRTKIGGVEGSASYTRARIGFFGISNNDVLEDVDGSPESFNTLTTQGLDLLENLIDWLLAEKRIAYINRGDNGSNVDIFEGLGNEAIQISDVAQMITNAAVGQPGEAALLTFLQNEGYTVHGFHSQNDDPAQVQQEYDLIWAGESLGSGDIRNSGDTYSNSYKPVIFAEPFNNRPGRWGLIDVSGGPNAGTTTTQMTIVGTHPITAGLTGTVTLVTTTSAQWSSEPTSPSFTGATDGQVLATFTWSGQERCGLAAWEVGSALFDSDSGEDNLNARFALVGFSGSDANGAQPMEFATADLETIVRQAVEWACDAPAETATGALLSASDSSLHFGAADSGSSATQTVTISNGANESSIALTGASFIGDAAGQYSILSGLPAVLGPGESVDVEVRWDAGGTEFEGQFASLLITQSGSAQDSPAINIGLAGYTTPVDVSGFTLE